MTNFHLHRFQLSRAETRRLFHKSLWKGLDDERREVSLRATHGLVAEARFRSLCPQVQGQLSCQAVLLLRSVSLHGLCSVDLSTQSPRYRNLLEFYESQTVSRWHSWTYRTQHFGPSQPKSRLAHLRRLWSDPHCTRPKTVCRKFFGNRLGTDGLRLRFHHHRSLPDSLPVGTVPASKSGRQAPHLNRSAWQHSLFRSYFQRENARCQVARSSADRTGLLLRHGSRLYRFCPSLPIPNAHGVLRHAGQKEPSIAPPKKSARGQDHGTTLRSNHSPYRSQHRRRISPVSAPRQVCGSGHRQAPRVPDQQLCARRAK